jgi:hypothetical protein
MKYYLHDSNSFNDEKITELYLEYGYEGLGLFYTILEKLALQEKPIKTKVLKHQLNVGKKLEKCWSFMEEIDLISTNNGETFNKQLLNFSKKYQVSKEKNAKRISQWRDNQAVSENVIRSEHVRNADKVKENKVNKIKENKESKDFIYSLDNFRNELFKKWINYKKEKKSSYTESGIKQLLLDWQDKSNEELEKAINNSISNNYQGLFEPKQQFNNGNTNNEPKLGTSAARMEALRKW